jgi:GNAT superfamily N-acetyltransferase
MLGDGFHDVPNDRIAAVVTHLQMFAKPAPRPEIAGPWQLQHLPKPDPETYRSVYRAIGDEWLWFSRIVMGDDELTSIIQHPEVEVYALKVGDKTEGMLELDFRVKDEAELGFFGVGPSLIGGGAARWLMNRAIDRAWQRPIKRFWVHTCTLDHPSAVKFYIRSGFVPFRRQIEIAPDPRLQGVSMASRKHTPMLVSR